MRPLNTPTTRSTAANQDPSPPLYRPATQAIEYGIFLRLVEWAQSQSHPGISQLIHCILSKVLKVT